MASETKTMGPEARIRYENTLDDVVAFNIHHVAASPTMRKAYHGAVNGLAAPVLLFAVAASVFLEQWVVALWGALFAVAYALLLRRGYWKNLRKTLRDFHSEMPNPSGLCEHTLTLTPEGIIESHAAGETRTQWWSVLRVVTTEEYTYLYTQPAGAHIVPRNRILEGSLEAFDRAVDRYATVPTSSPTGAERPMTEADAQQVFE